MSEDHSGFELPPGRLEPVDLDLEKSGLGRSATASIGKKYLMAWSGLLWCLFLVGHLLGNFGIFAGQDAYNSYSAKLMSLGPILIAIEAVLVLTLLVHMVSGIAVTLDNRRARPDRYEMFRSKGGRTVASRTMIWTGCLILVFLVFHLLNLKFGEHGTDPEGHVDLHTSTVALLANPVKAIGYVIAVVLVGLHAGHALQSSLRTIGLNHDKYTPRIAVLSVLFGVFLAVGYAAIPIWILAGGGR